MSANEFLSGNVGDALSNLTPNESYECTLEE